MTDGTLDPLVPVVVDSEEASMGAAAPRVARLMPPGAAIPKARHATTDPWHGMAEDWFFLGRASPPRWRQGLDGRLALRHLSALLRSFDVGHGAKIAAAAHLLATWCEEPS